MIVAKIAVEICVGGLWPPQYSPASDEVTISLMLKSM